MKKSAFFLRHIWKIEKKKKKKKQDKNYIYFADNFVRYIHRLNKLDLGHGISYKIHVRPAKTRISQCIRAG